ncbi:Hydroxyacylglutathione hydrolase [BD1-7 clade bacterium]|uniref:Hydroxyacylglutathione hydrolase n=1 Tax=BD1-7 clade bacterium TaxID=2029982 RepID=A0A5S9QVS4_9GAMM|nr:Hydroxyacylglutathione hydrolase [BD1-7 clade bacterium]CAA0122616.1 Hydroxyacylglutathione hydrolase [BD1-7 clade bacterium]
MQVEMIETQEPNAGELVEVAGGIFWLRMPLPMALNHINLYMIDEGDSWTVIDTGINLPDTKDAWEQIFATYCQDKPIGRVLVTHLHPDHVGLAGWLCDRWRCPLLMSQAEYFAIRGYTGTNRMHWQAESFYRRAGLGDDFIDFMQDRVGMKGIVSTVPGAYRRLKEGDSLTMGGRQWQIITGAGHSLEHVCLYNSDENLLIAGDQVLPRISPNVSVLATEPEASPLHNWYASLRALLVLPEDTFVLPAHNKPFYGLHKRCHELIDHHERQLVVLLSECVMPKKAIELMKPLFGREIGFSEMGLALGEAMAHLHMLMDREQLERIEREGIDYYRSLECVESDPSARTHDDWVMV